MSVLSCRSVLCASVLACLVPACAGPQAADAGEPKTIHAGERTVANTAKALSAQQLGALYGFYQGCTDPGLPGWEAGDATHPSWSIVATSGFVLPSGAPPAVLLLEGDVSSCNLVLTDVILNDAVGMGAPSDLTISGGAGMVLNNDGTYQASAAQLLKNGAAIAYINATSDQPGAPFAANFNVDIDLSDTLGTTGANGSGRYTVTTTGFPSVNDVPAPDYTASVTIADLLTDSSGIVTDAHGHVDLAFHAQEGLAYEILSGDVHADSFADLDTAFTSGSPTAFDPTGWNSSNGACGGSFAACPSFPLADFLSVGTDLSSPRVQTIVVQYVDPNGVATYETLVITLSAS